MFITHQKAQFEFEIISLFKNFVFYLFTAMQELIATYIPIEYYFLKESMNKVGSYLFLKLQ